MKKFLFALFLSLLAGGCAGSKYKNLLKDYEALSKAYENLGDDFRACKKESENYRYLYNHFRHMIEKAEQNPDGGS